MNKRNVPGLPLLVFVPLLQDYIAGLMQNTPFFSTVAVSRVVCASVEIYLNMWCFENNRLGLIGKGDSYLALPAPYIDAKSIELF